MMALGGGIGGGRVIVKDGTWPGLAPAQRFIGQDLQVTTDFRDVFAEALNRHMGLARLRRWGRCSRASPPTRRASPVCTSERPGRRRARRGPVPRCRSGRPGSSRSSSSHRPGHPARAPRAPGRETCGCAVHRCARPAGPPRRRSGPARLPASIGGVEAEARRPAPRRRIAQHERPSADHHRDVVGRDAERPAGPGLRRRARCRSTVRLAVARSGLARARACAAQWCDPAARRRPARGR